MTDRTRNETESEWPVELAGVTESVVTTLGPNDLWNVAALGLRGPAESDGSNASDDPEAADTPDDRDTVVTATTWGNTRTRRNFHRRGNGYVQFVSDPVTFVEAALSIYEVEEPILPSADAWVRVEVERVDSGDADGTRTETWALTPVEVGVERETVPTINRGFNAVVEATVAASRLDVDAYDTETLERRLEYFETVGENCGGDRVRTALTRLSDLAEGDFE